MSNDYRPRGGGGRNRRGGNRGGRPGQNRPQGQGYQSQSGPRTTTNNKPVSPVKKLINWLFKKGGTEKKIEGARPPRDNREGAPRRKPSPSQDSGPVAPVEVTTPKLYVGNLSYEAGEGDLFDLFSAVGAVRNVEVVMDRNRKQSKGFGFVEMETVDRAKAAVEQLNRTEFMGRQIVVSGAKSDRRTSTSDSDATPSAME